MNEDAEMYQRIARQALIRGAQAARAGDLDLAYEWAEEARLMLKAALAENRKVA